MAGISYKGTIVVPEGNDITISNAPSTLKVQLADGTVLTPVDGTVATSIKVKTLDELVDALNSDSSLPIVITETVVIPVDQEVTLDLKGKTVTGKVHKSVGAVIKNEGTLTLTNGTITSAAANGGSALVNSGTATVTGVTLNGAPNADGSWPSYTVNKIGDNVFLVPCANYYSVTVKRGLLVLGELFDEWYHKICQLKRIAHQKKRAQNQIYN